MEINREQGRKLLGEMIAEYLQSHCNSKEGYPHWLFNSVMVGDKEVEILILKGTAKHTLFKLSLNNGTRTFHMNPQLLNLLPQLLEDSVSGENIVNLFSVLDFNMRSL